MYNSIYGFVKHGVIISINTIIIIIHEGFQMSEFGSTTLPTSALSRFYRVPGLHVTLPTDGVFLPEGTFELTLAGDVPVLPMRGSDEMLLKSPDALMSGYALEKLFESCVPSIKTPRLISTPDLDVLLLAIRAATHGENMSLTAACPKCKKESDFDCHLPSLLSTMTKVDPVNQVRLSDEVMVYIRPFTLHSATTISLSSFEESRRLQVIEQSTKDGNVRSQEMNKTMSRMKQVTDDAMAMSIIKVVVPDAVVDDPKEIKDFFDNIPKAWSDKIEAKIKEVNNKGIDKQIEVKCSGSKCKHVWKTEVEFDPASFFDVASSR